MLYKIQYVTYCLWVCEQALQYITTYVTHARTHTETLEKHSHSAQVSSRKYCKDLRQLSDGLDTHFKQKYLEFHNF